MLNVFEQRAMEQEINFDVLNADMEMLYEYLYSELIYYAGVSMDAVSISDIHDYDWVYNRYLAGESIQQIVG